MKHVIKHTIYIIAALVMAAAVSCTGTWEENMHYGDGLTGNPGSRVENEDNRKVMLLYIAGYNDLQSYLKKNIDDLLKGWIPRYNRADDVVLVYSHLSVSRYDLTTPTASSLTRIYRDHYGETVTDTLVHYSPETIAASASQLNEVLTYIKDNFKAKSYGLIFSSHSTGYLPAGYYSKPGSYVFQEKMMYRQGRGGREAMTSVPYTEREHEPGRPETKSIGQSVHEDMSYEMELADFAEAIPMKLDYILFDSCLMGGIEVAYELADKCDRIGFSQTEVLAQGFNYVSLTSSLLNNMPESDPEQVCRDYIDYYDSQSGVYRSATISLVDCSKLEPVADACREIFSRYRNGIDNISPSKVQRYYTGNHRWFYDLESIAAEAGASGEDLDRLRDAIDMCVIYKGCTPSFLNDFDIETFSGFSMYLPRNGSEQLDLYYKTLRWNKATGLVP